MSDVKQVKVDNWGIYFLQRLKHFFNRTDYCDLTLQFQDNAQLKVHRLVLSACTEYFELLERTCEMYEDCLVMPDDLQADVVVPIINFMYTGQLEFKMDLLEKLYQTSLVMNMPVLTKLLASHRQTTPQQRQVVSHSHYAKRYINNSKTTPSTSGSATSKRSYSTAFETQPSKSKKQQVIYKSESPLKNGSQENNIKQSSSSSTKKFPVISKNFTKDPRPTRYELPEELDEDNIFDNSFTNISYTSKPLMVHPEAATKQYTPKRIKLFEEGNNSRFLHGSSNDLVECKKISSSNNSLFIDDPIDNADESDMYQTQTVQVKDNSKGASQLFDQIIENDCSNITIETKNKQSGNLDHAKIISEVLKKYPHLVKSNKNIKLKILNTSSKSKKTRLSNINEDKDKVKSDTPDFTYETDVIDSKEAARLIALGAENVKGPWICLICGTPGKALHFTTYFNFRKHLVEVHNEKPVPNICEYCGLKSQKRNYLVHHQLTKHNVEPPSHYHFPKCNYCKYVALNEALMVKHKLTHTEVKSVRRGMGNSFQTSNLIDFSATLKKSSKYGFERKQNLQCIYCLRNFTRETNLYAHLKINHKAAAKNDGLIEDSEEEIQEEEEKIEVKHNANDSPNYIKVEVPVTFEGSFDDTNIQYQIERQPDGNIHVVSKKSSVLPIAKHKILNPGYTTPRQNTPTPTISKPQTVKTNLNSAVKRSEFLQEMCPSPPSNSNSNSEEIVVIDNEYIVQDYKILANKEKSVGEYLMTTTLNTIKDESIQTIMPATSLEYHNMHSSNPEPKMFVKKSTSANQPIQIVVSNEEQYKALVSNQSVIFEDDDASKGLTVLAQDGSPLETATIDLDNTQSNDMMIIQDNYAINVSEAVAANNPNIVVVYTHPVADQNKQYQIITTQGVETQFVPSSAIITQNYETISTGTPVVTAHANIDNSWQNIQTNIEKLPMASNAELHTMAVAESVTVTPETDTNISNVQEYAEVPIETETIPISISQIVETQNQAVMQHNQNDYLVPNIVADIGNEINEVPVCQENAMLTLEHTTASSHQQPIQETHIQHIPADNLETTPMHTIISAPTINTIEQAIPASALVTLAQGTEQMQSNDLGTVFVQEMLQQEQPITTNTQTVIKSLIEEAVNTEATNEEVTQVQSIQQLPKEQIIEPEPCENIANIEESENDHQEISQVAESDVTENITEIETTVPEQNPAPNENENIEVSNISNIDVNIEPNPVAKVAIAQIENLASEWSEDENETIAEEAKIEKPEGQNNLEEAPELEESIENIQQEVEKHGSGEKMTYTKEITALPKTNLQKIENEHPEVNNEVQSSSQEKITSLLNDWDDNDSHEHSPTENKVDDQSKQESEEKMECNIEESVIDKSELNKSDNIKSLVSDWDEDEEENKE